MHGETLKFIEIPHRSLNAVRRTLTVTTLLYNWRSV